MHSRTTLIIAILVLGLVQTVFVLVTQNPGLDGQLIGPDGYAAPPGDEFVRNRQLV